MVKDTMAAAIFPQRYQQFQQILDAIENRQEAIANSLLNDIADDIKLDCHSAESIQTSFFLKALEMRIRGNSESGTSGKGPDNLYLLPDQGQQIHLFNFMAEKFPVVRYAQELANQHYANALAEKETITLWDIGIGSGQQMGRLLDTILYQGQELRRVRLLALDPSADSLMTARERIIGISKKAGFKLETLDFAKTVEDLTDRDWQEIEDFLRPAQGSWIANASFALHHVPPDLRDNLFQKIHQLNPASFCILEPLADFLEPDLRKRFEQTWNHYGLTFWAIDQINASNEQKNLLKSTFFGREVIDVLSRDTGRVEQFETGDMWATRLRRAGFPSSAIETDITSVPGFETIKIQALRHYTAMLALEYPLVGLFRAK